MIENRLKIDRRAKLQVAVGRSGPTESELRSLIQCDRLRIISLSLIASAHGDEAAEFSFGVRWQGRAEEIVVPALVHELTGRQGVIRVVWSPQLQQA